MAQIVKELRVDVSQPNVFQAIVAKQHDSNSRFLKITLVDFGVKVEVPNTAKVTINANRPDGASESFKGEANNDGTITVPLAQWMLDIDGEVKCDVSVTNTEDNKRLTSTDFWLEVQKAANPNASIPLDPDGEILIIKPVTEINGNSKDTDYPSAKAVYDYGQNIVTDTQITATATGSAITIESSQAPLQNLKLYGKTTQNGTPTPDNPIELKSVGDSGSFEVGVYGKNLCNCNATTQTINGVTCTNNGDGTYTLNGTATANAEFRLTTSFTLADGVRYILSGCASGGSDSTYYLRVWKNNSYKEKATDYGNGREFVFNKNEEVNLDVWMRIAPNVTVNKLVFKPMIRLASITDSTYEPYKAKQSLTLTDTLRGVGDIKDEVDFVNETKNQRLGYIASYNGETITTDYISSTGELSIGAEVVYVLPSPIETPISETELNAYRQIHTNKPNTTILSECEDTEITYYINKPNAQAVGNVHEQINKDYFKLQQAIISTGGSTL